MINKQKLNEAFIKVLQDYSIKEGPINSLNNLNIDCYFIWDSRYGIISLIDDVYYPVIHQFSRVIINFKSGKLIENHTNQDPNSVYSELVEKNEYVKNMLSVLNVQES